MNDWKGEGGLVGFMDGFMDGWLDKWLGGWVPGCMDVPTGPLRRGPMGVSCPGSRSIEGK